MRDAATPWAGTAANAAVVRNRTASDACAVTGGIVYQTRNTYVRSQAGALMPSDALQRVVERERAQASACALADGFAYSVTEPALVTSGISMHIIPLGNGNIDSRYPRAYGDMLYIADGAAMSDGAVSTVWSASGLDKNLHIGHDPDGDIDSTYVYTPPVNHAPLWTGAPATLTFTQGVGGTQAFNSYASDPDADTLTYSLVGTTYSGISINATTGLLTVTTAAASAVRALTIRITDPAGLFDDHACVVTIVSTASIKWYPGHYGQPNAHITPPKYAQYVSEINEVANVPANRMVGFSLLGVWGQVESTKGVYNWSKIREYRDQVVAQGKRVYLDWMFGCYGYGTTLSTLYFPQWAINEGLVGYSGSQQFLKFYRAAAMDRMILFYQAMAAEFENDEWVVMVATPETSHGVVAGDSDCTAANALIQWKRLVDALKTSFVRTPVIVQNNFLFNQSASSELSQYCIDNGVGLGGPDCILVPEEGDLNPDGWLSMYVKGWRYNGSAWVEGVAADQSSKILFSLGQQIVRSTAATPQKYYEEARDFYNCTHFVWQIKYQVYLGYAYDTRVPAMDWPNVESYLAAADRPLRAALPTNLGGNP